MQYWCCREKIQFDISSLYGLKTLNRYMNNLRMLQTTHCMGLIDFKFVSAWPSWFRRCTKSLKRCKVQNCFTVNSVEVFFISSPVGWPLRSSKQCVLNFKSFAGDAEWSKWTGQHVSLCVLTIFVARFVDQTRLVCQQCIDLYDFSCQWRIQLTGCLHTFQSSKFICQRKRRGLLHLTLEILKKKKSL